eukprot:Rhum_TRINITY_DN8762_c0_g2::Rhum_TRINITY_DN8762_c0_g2_i1::g.29433::m.29433
MACGACNTSQIRPLLLLGCLPRRLHGVRGRHHERNHASLARRRCIFNGRAETAVDAAAAAAAISLPRRRRGGKLGRPIEAVGDGFVETQACRVLRDARVVGLHLLRFVGMLEVRLHASDLRTFHQRVRVRVRRPGLVSLRLGLPCRELGRARVDLGRKATLLKLLCHLLLVHGLHLQLPRPLNVDCPRVLRTPRRQLSPLRNLGLEGVRPGLLFLRERGCLHGRSTVALLLLGSLHRAFVDAVRVLLALGVLADRRLFLAHRKLLPRCRLPQGLLLLPKQPPLLQQLLVHLRTSFFFFALSVFVVVALPRGVVQTPFCAAAAAAAAAESARCGTSRRRARRKSCGQAGARRADVGAAGLHEVHGLGLGVVAARRERGQGAVSLQPRAHRNASQTDAEQRRRTGGAGRRRSVVRGHRPRHTDVVLRQTLGC